MATKRHNRVAAGLLIGGALLLIAAVSIPVVTSIVSPSTAQAQAQAATQVATCATSTSVHFYTLDAGKQSTLAFGPTAKMDSIAADVQELHNRRVVDPALMAAHEAYEGIIPETTQAMDSEEAKLMADRTYWCGQLDTMEKAEAGYTASLTNVAKGLPTLYMVAATDKASATINKGHTAAAGTALTYTKPDGTTFQYRLECGFQPIIPSTGFPAVPECNTDTSQCTPPTVPPTTPPTPPTECKWPLTNGKCLQPKDHSDDVTPPAGTSVLSPDPLQNGTSAGTGSSGSIGTSGSAGHEGATGTGSGDHGSTVPVTGATQAPAPVVTPPTIPQAPAPSAAPTAPICDPDLGC